MPDSIELVKQQLEKELANKFRKEKNLFIECTKNEKEFEQWKKNADFSLKINKKIPLIQFEYSFAGGCVVKKAVK